MVNEPKISIYRPAPWLFGGMAIAFGLALFVPIYALAALGCGAFAAAIVLAAFQRKHRKLQTNAHNADAELRLALERANTANQTKSKFLAMVSHEIRTPLNGVLGMAQLLKETPLEPAQSDYVKAIDTSGRALLGLIEDLLDSARIESGHFNLHPGPCDIRKIVEDVADMVAPLARAKGVDVATHIAADVPQSVIVDSSRLRQVLLNLAGNAAKFTEQGGFALTVSADETTLRFSVEDSGPGLSTDDQTRVFKDFAQASNGTTRVHEGAGLGLSISQNIVRAMTGNARSGIKLESNVGEGSTFSFEIPLLQNGQNAPLAKAVDPSNACRILLHLADTPARAALVSTLRDLGVTASEDRSDVPAKALIADETLLLTNEPLDNAVPAYWLGDAGNRAYVNPDDRLETRHWLTWPVRQETLRKMLSEELTEQVSKPASSCVETPKLLTSKKKLSVLVAEDNPINAMLVTAMLGKLGHSITRVENGAQAVQKVQSERGPFDLILMDLHMPEMDGVSAIHAIRRWEQDNRQSPHKIYVLSADGQADTERAALTGGADGFLLKPLDIDAVRALLESEALAA